jgi:hypothetical protein
MKPVTPPGGVRRQKLPFAKFLLGISHQGTLPNSGPFDARFSRLPLLTWKEPWMFDAELERRRFTADMPLLDSRYSNSRRSS